MFTKTTISATFTVGRLSQSRFMAAIEQAERQTGCRVLVSVTRCGLFSSDLNLQVTGTPAAIRIAGRIMDEVIAQ
jgi:hypothetical protein